MMFKFFSFANQNFTMLKFILLFAIIQLCFASIEQVGDTQINIINKDGKLIKQNLIEIQCEYGLDNVFDKTFSTTSNSTEINISCPNAVKKYIKQEKGYVPKESYVKSMQLCESGVTPLWDYDRDRITSTSRRLQALSIEDVLASRKEFESTFDKMINTEQLGCIDPAQFYGDTMDSPDACNVNGTRYSLWKNYMERNLTITDDNGDKQSCWDLYTSKVKTGLKIDFNSLEDSPSNIGELFRCFVSINGFANMKSNSESKEINLHCAGITDPEFDDDNVLLGLNSESQSACDVSTLVPASVGGGTGAASGALAYKVAAVTTVKMAALPAFVGAGAFALAYCLTQNEFEGLAIRVTKSNAFSWVGFDADAAYPFDTKCPGGAMAFEPLCMPSNDDLMYDVVHCNGDRCRWKDGDALQQFIDQYYTCAVARQSAKNDAVLKKAVETNSKSIAKNMEAIVKLQDDLIATNENLRDLAGNVTALTDTVSVLAAETEQNFQDVNNDLFIMGNNLTLALEANVLDLTALINDTANALADDLEEISRNLTSLIDTNTNLISDVKDLVTQLDIATGNTFEQVQIQFENQSDQILQITEILLENFYKESTRNRQIVDLYENIVDAERKMDLRLSATREIQETIKIWNEDESLDLFTLQVGEPPYYQIGDNRYIPIFTQVWKNNAGLFRYYMFMCDGERLASFASINIDISLLLSLFDEIAFTPICMITKHPGTDNWISGSPTVQEMLTKTLFFDDTLTYTDYIIEKQQYLIGEYEVKTYSAADYGLHTLDEPILFTRYLETDTKKDFATEITNEITESAKLPQKLYKDILISLPYDANLERLWLLTSSTLGLLATRRHYGYIGDDVAFTLRAGQSSEFGDIINCVDVSLVAVNSEKKTIFELSSPSITFGGSTQASMLVDGMLQIVFYENLEFISTTDLPETLRIVDQFPLGTQNNFNVYDIPYSMIKIADNPEARLGSVNYIMTNTITNEFARDVWAFEYNTFRFKPESHIGLQSFLTEYDLESEKCVTFNNGVCAALEHFTVLKSDWSEWEPKNYRVKFQIRLEEDLDIVIKLEDGCPNIVGTDKLLIVENNNNVDIAYQVTINGQTTGQPLPIFAQERDQFTICLPGETSEKDVAVTNPDAECPTQKMFFNCSQAVHEVDRDQLIADVNQNTQTLIDTVQSDFTSQIVTVTQDINGTITTLNTTLAEATKLVQTNLDDTKVEIEGQIVDLNAAMNTNLTNLQQNVDSQIANVQDGLTFQVDLKVQAIADELAQSGNITITYDTAVFDAQVAQLESDIETQKNNIDTTIQNIEISINATRDELNAQYAQQIDDITAETNATITANNAKLAERLDNITNSFGPVQDELEVISNNTKDIQARADQLIADIEADKAQFLMDQFNITENATKALQELDRTFGTFTFDALLSDRDLAILLGWIGTIAGGLAVLLHGVLFYYYHSRLKALEKEVLFDIKEVTKNPLTAGNTKRRGYIKI